MDGTVEGEEVRGAQDAFYDTEVYQVGPFRYRLFAVFVTSAYDACEGLDLLEEVDGICAEQCADFNEIANEHLTGDTLWTLALLFSTTTEVEQDYKYDVTGEDASFSAALYRVDIADLYEREPCMEACEEDDLMPSDSWTARGGSAAIRGWNEDGDLRGRYEARFRDGDVEGRFRADFCPGLFW
jgi:hypothetical protein